MINIEYSGASGTGVGTAINSFIETMSSAAKNDSPNTKFIYLLWDESSEFSPLVRTCNIVPVKILDNPKFCFDILNKISDKIQSGSVDKSIFLLKAWELNPAHYDIHLQALIKIMDSMYSNNSVRVCLIRKRCYDKSADKNMEFNF